MRFVKRFAFVLLIGMIGILSANSASAEFITNGTFDSDLTGWTTEAGTTTDVTWKTGTASVGQTGTPGIAIFSQSFDIASGTSQVLLKFDYEWQVTPPSSVDRFSAQFVYQSTSGAQTVDLVNEGSDTGVFGSVTSFSSTVGLTDLDNVANNGTIRFTLEEFNSPTGTRVRVDNVSAVPEPTTLAMFSVLGLVFSGRRRRK